MTGSEDGDSWRQYADELTPEQIQHFEESEARLDPAYRYQLVELAQEEVERNHFVALHGDRPLPPGSELVLDWVKGYGPDFYRIVKWMDYSTGLPSVEVCLDGLQNPDGSYNQRIGFYVDDELALTAEQARAVAAALLKAADDLDSR